MNQLTVRGFDDQLSDSVRRLAAQEGISLNQAALKLLRKGAGLAEGSGKPGTVGSSLDHLIGTWTEAEADELDAALQELEIIDDSIWPHPSSSCSTM